MTTASRATASRPSLLTFVTGEAWTVEELEQFLASVETAYGLLLALLWISRESEGVDRRRDAYFIAMQLREHLGSTRRGGEVQEYEQMLARGSYPAEQKWLLTELRQRLYPRLPSSLGDPDQARLRLLAVRMESPGLVSFEGLAGVMSQLRELFKDFWWRNAHERKMSGLELRSEEIRVARQYLKLQREYQASVADNVSGGIDPATILLVGALHDFGDLEQAGKLKRRPDALDQLPSDVEP